MLAKCDKRHFAKHLQSLLLPAKLLGNGVAVSSCCSRLSQARQDEDPLSKPAGCLTSHGVLCPLTSTRYEELLLGPEAFRVEIEKVLCPSPWCMSNCTAPTLPNTGRTFYACVWQAHLAGSYSARRCPWKSCIAFRAQEHSHLFRLV